MTKGFVYFVACKDPEYRIVNPHMKIGWTTDIKGRLSTIQTGSPVELCVMGYVESEDATKLERYFHTLFKKDKKHGEWFDVTVAMITRINCYPICDNHLHEFFLLPKKNDGEEVAALKIEINTLKSIIDDKNRTIKSLNIVKRAAPGDLHFSTRKRECGKFARSCKY